MCTNVGRLRCLGQVLVMERFSPKEVKSIDEALKTPFEKLEETFRSEDFPGDANTKDLLAYLATADLEHDLECLIMSWDKMGDYEREIESVVEDGELPGDLKKDFVRSKKYSSVLCICAQYPKIAARLCTMFMVLKAKEELNMKLKDENANIIGDKVKLVFNPLLYAWNTYKQYVAKYCGRKKVLFVGLNTGKYSSALTGIPMSNEKLVKEEMNIKSSIDWKKVSDTEVESKLKKWERKSKGGKDESGKRFWELVKKLWGTPNTFFKNCFLVNYSPLLLLDKKGNHFTIKKSILKLGDEAMKQCIDAINPELIIAIGQDSEERLKSCGTRREIKAISHPSPINDVNRPAGQLWWKTAEKELEETRIFSLVPRSTENNAQPSGQEPPGKAPDIPKQQPRKAEVKMENPDNKVEDVPSTSNSQDTEIQRVKEEQSLEEDFKKKLTVSSTSEGGESVEGQEGNDTTPSTSSTSETRNEE